MEKKPKKAMTTKLVGLIVVVALLVVLLVVLGPKIIELITSGQAKTVTTTKLEKAININELSSAEFVYNGIVQVYENQSEKLKYNVRYDASVKVGIQMDKVSFEINQEMKTIKPILPEISINNIIINPSNIGYIPENASVDLKEAFAACKKDAQEEASKTKELYDVAEENVKSTIEALLYPILESDGYTIIWGE